MREEKGRQRAVEETAVDLIQPLRAVAGPKRHRMDLPGRRRSGMGSVRHRAGPLREAGPVECTTSRSGKLRVPSPLPLGQARSGERNGNDEAQPVDCVRIVHKAANVENKLPRSVQPAAKADLREIWMAPDRATAEAAANSDDVSRRFQSKPAT